MKKIFIALMLALLTHAGFILAHKETDYKLVLVIFFLALATMLQNDYFNRKDDAWGKNKRLVFDNPKTFVVILIILWGAIVSYCFYLYYQELYWQCLVLSSLIIKAWVLCFLGRGNSLLLKIGISYAIGIPVLLALDWSNIDTWGCLILFVFVFCFVLGRELLIKNYEKD